MVAGLGVSSVSINMPCMWCPARESASEFSLTADRQLSSGGIGMERAIWLVKAAKRHG